jgi:sugar phosphate isomerase/epimerase
MVLGISSFTYGWAIGVEGFMPSQPWNEDDLLSQTKQFALPCLQIGDNLPLHFLSTDRLSNLSQRCKENEIRLEIGARSLTDENLEKYISLAKSLDAKLLRFVIDGNNYEPDAATVISILKNHEHKLSSEGLKIGIENHDRLRSNELVGIMEACDSDYIGICLDCVNSMGAGEGLEQVAENLVPFTINLHIKDFTVTRLSHKMGFVITGSPAGKGMINLPWLVEKLSHYGRCESAVLEQWVVPEKTIDATVEKEKQWAEESIRYIKALSLFQTSPQHLNIIK